MKNTIIILLGIMFTSTGCNKSDKDASSCTDGIKNGNETGIDCGGDCAACPAPVACISAALQNIEEGTPTYFSNCSQNAVSYLWNFGDGSTSSEFTPAHTFAEGVFTVTLTATGQDGSKSTDSVQITATNRHNGTYQGKECGASWATHSLVVTITGNQITIDGLNQGGFVVTGNMTSPTTFDIPDQNSTSQGTTYRFIGNGSFTQTNGAKTLNTTYGWGSTATTPTANCVSTYYRL